MSDQSAEWFDTGGGATLAKDLRATHIPGGQTGERTTPFIFKLHTHRFARFWRQRRMNANAGLNTGLFVGGDDELVTAQLLVLPSALV